MVVLVVVVLVVVVAVVVVAVVLVVVVAVVVVADVVVAVVFLTAVLFSLEVSIVVCTAAAVVGPLVTPPSLGPVLLRAASDGAVVMRDQAVEFASV